MPHWFLADKPLVTNIPGFAHNHLYLSVLNLRRYYVLFRKRSSGSRPSLVSHGSLNRLIISDKPTSRFGTKPQNSLPRLFIPPSILILQSTPQPPNYKHVPTKIIITPCSRNFVSTYTRLMSRIFLPFLFSSTRQCFLVNESSFRLITSPIEPASMTH